MGTGFTSGAMSPFFTGPSPSYAREKRSSGLATNPRSSIRSRRSRFTPRARCAGQGTRGSRKASAGRSCGRAKPASGASSQTESPRPRALPGSCRSSSAPGSGTKRPAAVAPPPRSIERDTSPIDSRLDLLTRRAAAKAAQAAPAQEIVPIIPTQAVVRNQSDDAVPTLLPSTDTPAAPTARTTQPQPKRDRMVQLAGRPG